MATPSPPSADGADLADALRGARYTAERLMGLVTLGAALSEALRAGDVGRVVCEQAVPAFGAAAGSMLLLEGEELVTLSTTGFASEAMRPWNRYPLARRTPGADVARTGEAVLLERLAAWDDRYPEWATLPRDSGYEAYAALPMIFGGSVLGVLTFNFVGARSFDADDRRVMLAFAQQAAGALDRARLFAAERAARADAEAARAAAETAGEAKGEFLATMSHELRTPINAMIGYTQLLEMGLAGTVSAAQREYLDRLRSSSEHLLTLVNDVLDLARLDADRMTVLHERATVRRTIQASIALVRPQAEAKGVRLLDAPVDAPNPVYVGDEHRVRQVLVNLLGNAVKFTESGGTVEIAAETVAGAPAGVGAPGGTGPWVVVRVTDTGVGITPEEQRRVFEPFHQVEGGHTRRAGGTGLGLAISRRLARLMGGDLVVQSTRGVGSVFTLWLPAPGESGVHGDTGENAAVRLAPSGGAVLPAASIASMDKVGGQLRAALDDVLAAYVDRLSADPELPRARTMRRTGLEDHALSLLADLAQSLVIVADVNAETAGPLRDSSAIQRTIAEAHGARRYAQGWSEANVRRDHQLLREEVERAVRARLPAKSPEVDTAVSVLIEMLNRVGAISLRAWRGAANAEGER